MKSRVVKIRTVVLGIVCLALFCTAGRLWWRSMQFADYIYRVVPDAKGSALRGFGSYRGAMVFGSIMDSSPVDGISDYRHDIYILTGGKMLKPIPDSKIGGLGFGVSHGQLQLNLPMAFLLPRRTYQVVYVPYYFVMLLAAMYPCRVGMRLLKNQTNRESTGPFHRTSTPQFSPH